MKIKAETREEKGGKARTLLRVGTVPAVVYGPATDVKNIKINSKEFVKVYKDAQHSKIIDLELEGDKTLRKVLIREFQFHPVTEDIIHASFYELDLKKQITVDVPVVMNGIARAVKDNIGFLVTPVEEITVRCLPDKLPSQIEIDIDNLNEIGDSITLGNVKLPEGVTLAMEHSDSVALAYIAPPQKEIVEEVVAPAEGEEVAEGEEGEKKEGEEGEEAAKTEEEEPAKKEK